MKDASDQSAKVIYLIPTYSTLAALTGEGQEQYINPNGDVFIFWNGALDTKEARAARPPCADTSDEKTLILEAA